VRETLLFCSKFLAIFGLHHAYMRKDIRLSPLLCSASDETWVGPGN